MLTHAISVYCYWVVAVDAFFYLTGFLLTIHYLPRFQQAGRAGAKSYPKMILYRWLRMTPNLVMVIAVFTILVSQLGKSSFAIALDKEVRDCKAGWWRNLLYINNFQSLADSCYNVT